MGGQKALGQNALAPGSARSPQALHLCADGTSLPKLDCDLAAIGLACLFLNFKKISLYRSCFSPKPRMGTVIMMPRNPSISLWPRIPIKHQVGLESPWGLTFHGDWKWREEGMASTRGG